MVEFVLNAHGQQTFGFDGALFAVLVKGFHLHMRGAFHAIVNTGHRQTAFVAFDALVTHPGDFGVDEHHGLVALFRGVNHHQALVHIHLRGSQADAIGVVHGFQHVRNQGLDTRVNLFDGLGHGVKLGVGESEDV